MRGGASMAPGRARRDGRRPRRRPCSLDSALPARSRAMSQILRALVARRPRGRCGTRARARRRRGRTRLPPDRGRCARRAGPAAARRLRRAGREPSADTFAPRPARTCTGGSRSRGSPRAPVTLILTVQRSTIRKAVTTRTGVRDLVVVLDPGASSVRAHRRPRAPSERARRGDVGGGRWRASHVAPHAGHARTAGRAFIALPPTASSRLWTGGPEPDRPARPRARPEGRGDRAPHRGRRGQGHRRQGQARPTAQGTHDHRGCLRARTADVPRPSVRARPARGAWVFPGSRPPTGHVPRGRGSRASEILSVTRARRGRDDGRPLRPRVVTGLGRGGDPRRRGARGRAGRPAAGAGSPRTERQRRFRTVPTGKVRHAPSRRERYLRR